MHHPGLTVGDVMHGKYPVADPGEGLASVLGRLPSDGSAVVVLQDHHLVGVLDPEHIGKLLEVRGVVAGHAA